MNAELTPDVKTLAFVVLTATIGLALFVPAASAQEAACTEILENQSEADNASAPGGLLADAIGDQRDEIGNQIGERAFDARLENATSARERAEIVADEVERIRANVSTIERCWGINGSEQVADRSLAELDDDERAALENHTRSLHERLNATRNESDSLPASLREEYDVDRESVTSLERRVVAVRNATVREEAASERPFPFP